MIQKGKNENERRVFQGEKRTETADDAHSFRFLSSARIKKKKTTGRSTLVDYIMPSYRIIFCAIIMKNTFGYFFFLLITPRSFSLLPSFAKKFNIKQ